MLGWMSVTTGLTIAEAAQLSGVSAHTLRYYERAGLIGGVDRAASGHRRYGEDDLAWIHTIQCLRATGMPIREIRRYADLVRCDEDNLEARLALLEKHRVAVQAQLDEARGHLAFIDCKIDTYKDRISNG
jgi:DNA-binding transcriptional MerR regulator